MTAALPLVLLGALASPGAKAADPPITAIAFAPGGDAVVVGSQAGLEVRSWPGLIPERSLGTAIPQVHDLAFSPRGDVLAVAGGDPAVAGIVELYDWPSGALLRRVEPHGDSVLAVDWRPDSDALATASLDRTARILSMTGEPDLVFEGHSGGVVAVAYLPGGRTLVTGGLDQCLRVWDTSTGRPLRRLDNHLGAVLGLALRPARAEGAPPMVASIGADRTLRLWQPTIGRMVRLARLESDPTALDWLTDGRAVAVACADGHVRLIDPETVAILADLPAFDGRPYCLVTAPDSSLLVGGQAAYLLSLAPPLPGQELPLPPRPADAAGGTAFARSIADLPLREREERILAEVRAGNVPDFLRTLIPVTVSAGGRSATFDVAADYLAVGSDEDPFFTPLTPVAAQAIADELDCTLPTPKMVDDIHAASRWKWEPSPIPPSPAMTTVPVFLRHNAMLLAQREGTPRRGLVAGTKKDVVIANALFARPGKVAIYGWHHPDGTPIQPLYTGHIAAYADYSHGVRLVRRRMTVDGEPTTVEAVLADPALAPLLSGEGVLSRTRYDLHAP